MDKPSFKRLQLKHGEDYYIKILLKETKLRDIMTEKVVAISIDAPFREVPKKFQEHGIRHLPVIDAKGQLMGLMSQRDFFKIIPPKKLMDGQWCYDEESLDGIILAYVMTKEVLCMGPDDTVGDALVQMVKNKYGCIPIVDGKNILKGIITQYDILSAAAQIYLE